MFNNRIDKYILKGVLALKVKQFRDNYGRADLTRITNGKITQK